MDPTMQFLQLIVYRKGYNVVVCIALRKCSHYLLLPIILNVIFALTTNSQCIY